MALSKYKEYQGAYSILSRSSKTERLASAYIIEGDNIINKRDLAVNFAKSFLCGEMKGEGCDRCSVCRKIDHGNYEDLYFIGLEDKRSIGVDKIRKITESLMTMPIGEGGRNVVIIEDGDYMTLQAQNVLLKTLEEPPAGTVIIILSENTERLINTIRSRCITVRLFKKGVEDNPFMEVAKKAVEMSVSDATFLEVRNYLKKNIKNEKDARVFLDGMERLMAEYMIGNDSRYVSRDMAKKFVTYIEEAAGDLRYNVGYRYALRNLMLRMSM